jgi:hypothetical protein
MSADTKYYAKIPFLTWKWVEVPAVTAEEVWEKHPLAMEVLHHSEYENRADL